jgi:hypothetical protein
MTFKMLSDLGQIFCDNCHCKNESKLIGAVLRFIMNTRSSRFK